MHFGWLPLPFIIMLLAVKSLKIRRPLVKLLARPLSQSSYDHTEVEKKWQTTWNEQGVFRSPSIPKDKKKYILDMFPYPSGAGLHVGHPAGYTATDILSRYWRMNEYDVLHPMGWDAFGLPAEQHAIITGTHPATTTGENIATFKRQLQSLGFSYDWERELSTTDENYVRWTQWIFVQLFKKGLAFQSNVAVNWCSELGTVLANEEVIDGKSERGGFPVIRMPLRQWVLRITDYADRLLKDLEKLDWPEGTLSAQRQWIGKSDGFILKFGLENDTMHDVEVFTSRIETLLGATYVVLAPEHPLVGSLTASNCSHQVQQYCEEASRKSDLERTSYGIDRPKSGVFLGTHVVHPISKELLPVWIADYVMMGYGTGAVMGVPAHDERDYSFAVQFDLPIRMVVNPADGSPGTVPYCEEGVLINSGQEYNGLDTKLARAVMGTDLSKRGFGKTHTTYKLRDWIFSRQRYWGEPIPIFFPVKLNAEDDNPFDHPHEILYDQPMAVDESELPLRLPNLSNFLPGDDPAGCLARAKDWRYFKKDGKWFARETNTMPQWAGSCWYYLRFIDPHNNGIIFGKAQSKWLPVDLYVGGQEHAVLHLLYARFWHKVLFDLQIVDHPEPFSKLVHQGMILGTDGEKMSKSRGNVINPDDVVKEHGADALRLYEMFMGPLESVKPWQTAQLVGVVRFREKVFSLTQRSIADVEPSPLLLAEIHRTIKKVTGDIEKMAFNTAISSMMIFANTLSALEGPIPRAAVKSLLLLLSPFAPHVAEECWYRLGESGLISQARWPSFDEDLCSSKTSVVAIQVNGKVRATLELDNSCSKEDAMDQALSLPGVTKHLQHMKINRTVYIQGKILNIVAQAV